jgi:hypothetical protein
MKTPIALPPLPTNPTVSVVTASFDDARWLGDAIESALAQTLPILEHVIVDDGSTDQTPEMLRFYGQRDGRVRSFRTVNRGQTAAMNLGVAKARGDILLFLDGDDRFRPNKVETVVATLRGRPDAGLVNHRIACVDQSGRVMDQFPPLASVADGWLGPQLLRAGGFIAGIAPTSGLGIRREVAEVVLPLPDTFRVGFDVALSGTAALVTSVAGIDEALAEYRWAGDNAMFSAGLSADVLRLRIEHQQATWALQREFLATHAPEEALGLASLECSRVHLEQRLTLARLERDPDHRALRRQLAATPDYREQHAARRLFWEVAPRLPRSVFLAIMDQLYRPSATRRALSSLGTRARVLRGHGRAV